MATHEQRSELSELEMIDDSDVPPLEDMSAVFSNVDLSETSRPQKPLWQVQSITQEKKIPVILEEKPKALENKSSKSSSFAGMKKGFLFGSSPNDKQQKKSEAIPLIKPKVKAQDEHRIKEVQDALKVSQHFTDNQDWVTDDLLSNLQKNEKVLTKLQNPHFMQAITEFQTNPQAALAKYSGNAEMESFFKEFCGLLGSHFTKMSDQQSTQSQPQRATEEIQIRTQEVAEIKVHDPHEEEDKKVQDLLADSEIRDILLDPEIRNLIESLKVNPTEAQRILNRSSYELKTKVSKLVDRGVLQFQR